MHIRLLVPMVLAFWPSSLLMAQTRPPQITVSGSAEVKVVPDEVYLRLGVETRDVNLDTAKRQNDERIEKVLKFLRKNGIPDKNLQTDFMSISPAFDYPSTIKPTHYVVRKSVEVKLTDLRRFEKLLSGAIENGISHVHGIDFRTSELRKHRDQARAMAARAAREKADALAAELDAKRGRVISIDENYWGGWWSGSGSYWGSQGGSQFQNVMQEMRGTPGLEEGTLSVGQISVAATVNASFAIE